jgi:hypothetical protein
MQLIYSNEVTIFLWHNGQSKFVQSLQVLENSVVVWISPVHLQPF